MSTVTPPPLPESAGGTQAIAPLPRVSIQAFCETPDVAQAIQSASSDRRMEKAHVKVQMGGGAAAIEAYRNAPTPNVILVESDRPRDDVIATLDRLAEVCDPGTKVIIIGRVNDVLLYRELMKRGVSEYLVAPIQTLDVVRTLSDLFRAPDAEPVGRSIAFVGAKGGVGASTVAHNVSWAIARNMELDTVVVDLDLAFGTAGLDFNQDPPQGIAELVFAPERLDANMVDRLLSKCTEHLTLLAAPSTLDRTYDFNSDVFDGMMDVLRANVPCIILDVPHVWTAWTRRLMVLADEIVITAVPDLANLRNTKNFVDLLRNMRPNDKPPRLIINQMGMPKRPEIKVSDFVKAVDLEPIAVLPFDPGLFGAAANNGQMIAEMDAANKINELFFDVARVLTGRSDARIQKKNMFEPLLSRLNLKRA
jgi:pilus assembly protein CpaE